MAMVDASSAPSGRVGLPGGVVVRVRHLRIIPSGTRAASSSYPIKAASDFMARIRAGPTRIAAADGSMKIACANAT